MSTDNQMEKKGIQPDPSQTAKGPETMQSDSQNEEEGSFRDVQTSVNRNEDFGDDDESQQEDEIDHGEEKNESKSGTGKS